MYFEFFKNNSTGPFVGTTLLTILDIPHENMGYITTRFHLYSGGIQRVLDTHQLQKGSPISNSEVRAVLRPDLLLATLTAREQRSEMESIQLTDSYMSIALSE